MVYLDRDQVARFYDRLGRGQDWQRLYESPAVEAMLRHGAFGEARRVVEVGCGTGSLARELVEHHLPAGASYLGLDLSQTMLALSRARLAPFGERVELRRADAVAGVDTPDASVDRLVACYVLDLLSPDDIHRLLVEAARLLRPAGRLCVTNLTRARSLHGRALTGLWEAVHRRRPGWVGGCRPLELAPLLEGWTVLHREVRESFGLASEVTIARPT